MNVQMRKTYVKIIQDQPSTTHLCPVALFWSPRVSYPSKDNIEDFSLGPHLSLISLLVGGEDSPSIAVLQKCLL